MRRAFAVLLLIILAATPAMSWAQNITKPDDPRFSDQWALKKLGARCAWGHTTGNPDVLIAVVDSGVDLQHPDLVARLRAGRDFVDNDEDASDENGHGTNVAGIIAATLNNGEGVSGLAPNVSILPVRVMNAQGRGSDRAISRGIRYSADQGAKVINLSLGATLASGEEVGATVVTEAIKYAQSKGALVIAAAGNDFVPLPNSIVGDNPDVMVIAALDEDDNKADFSNSGPWITVAAPGVHILSTMPTYEVYLTSNAIPRDERFEQNYDYMSGTSQATPYVAALAGLLFSAHPDWSARQVAEEIRRTAMDISRQNPDLAERGWIGSGRIDPCNAFGGPVAEAEPENPPPAIELPITAPDLSGLVVLGALVCGVGLIAVIVLVVLARPRRRPAVVPQVPVFIQPPPRPIGPPPPVVAPPPAVAPIGAVVAWGWLHVIGGPSEPRQYQLAGADVLIGRSSECAILLAGDNSISRRHAIVRNDGHFVTVVDAGSTHGTFLNGTRVIGPVAVRRGDILQVGQTLLRFE